MKHVYLDQNQWSYLSLALRGEPRTPEDATAAEAVRRSVAAGSASFPLSTAHVFETWKQHSAQKRQPLAETMMCLEDRPRNANGAAGGRRTATSLSVSSGPWSVALGALPCAQVTPRDVSRPARRVQSCDDAIFSGACSSAA